MANRIYGNTVESAGKAGGIIVDREDGLLAERITRLTRVFELSKSIAERLTFCNDKHMGSVPQNCGEPQQEVQPGFTIAELDKVISCLEGSIGFINTEVQRYQDL